MNPCSKRATSSLRSNRLRARSTLKTISAFSTLYTLTAVSTFSTLSTLCSSSIAQDSTPQQAPAVVVTATSREQPIQDVQASVQVITSKDLAGFSGSSITETLQMAAGVDARPNGASSFVAVRGFISNAGSPVLILVDGLRRTGKYGGNSLNLMGLEEVERIEIVRGPMSALYGADATGGVINIITKAPRPGQQFGGSARVTLGATDDWQRKTSILGATVYAGGEQSGHRISVEQRNKGLFRYPGTASTTSDLSKIDESYLNYEGVYRLAPEHQIRWLLEYVDQNDTTPAVTARAPVTAFTGYERETRDFASLRYQGTVGPGVLSLDLSNGNSKASTTRSFPTIETTKFGQTQFDARYAIDLPSHSIVAGTGWRKDDLDVSIVPQIARTTNKYVLLQDEWRLAPSWRLLVGVRHDSFSTFGSATTPRASIAFNPGPWNFRVGYGEAYRAPSALEQYSRFVRGRFLILGAADIQPETNKTWEIAAAYNTRDLNAEWVLFRSNVGNLIQTVQSTAVAGDPAGVTLRSTYTNIGKALLQGSELNLSWRMHGQWSGIAGWDYLDGQDTLTRTRLVQRARHTFRIGGRYEQGPWRVDIRGRFLKDYFASVPVTPPAATPDPVNTNFATLDSKVDYRLDKAWSISFGIDNVFNRRQPSNFSATGSVQDPPGRFGYLMARYKF